MNIKISCIDDLEIMNLAKDEITKLEITKENPNLFFEKSCEKILDYKNLKFIYFWFIFEKEIDIVNNKLALMNNLVHIYTFNEWGVKNNMLECVKNLKYNSHMLITDLCVIPKIENITHLNLNALTLDNFFWIRINPKKCNIIELLNLRKLLVNLPFDLEYLQLVISCNVFTLAKLEFNLPVCLKIFNLQILYCKKEDIVITDDIKIPFGCEFNIYKYD